MHFLNVLDQVNRHLRDLLSSLWIWRRFALAFEHEGLSLVSDRFTDVAKLSGSALQRVVFRAYRLHTCWGSEKPKWLRHHSCPMPSKFTGKLNFSFSDGWAFSSRYVLISFVFGMLLALDVNSKQTLATYSLPQPAVVQESLWIDGGLSLLYVSISQ